MNLSSFIPESLGLYIFKYTNFDVFSAFTLGLSFAILPLCWFWAKSLESKDVSAFKILPQEEPNTLENELSTRNEEQKSEKTIENANLEQN